MAHFLPHVQNETLLSPSKTRQTTFAHVLLFTLFLTLDSVFLNCSFIRLLVNVKRSLFGIDYFLYPSILCRTLLASARQPGSITLRVVSMKRCTKRNQDRA